MLEEYSLMGEAGEIRTARDARLALADPAPSAVRFVAKQVDHLRFEDPPLALEVAEEALSGLGLLPTTQQRKSLVFLCWTVYASACRAMSRFDDAEQALGLAASAAGNADEVAKAEIALRLAYVRAEQGRQAETERLVAFFLETSRRLEGGIKYGQRLTDAGSILCRFDESNRASAFFEEALSLLPLNGNRYHLSALFGHANATLRRPDASSSDLEEVLDLASQLLDFVEAGSFVELRLHWLSGKILGRLGLHTQGLNALAIVRHGIENRSSGYDNALLLVDTADLLLRAGKNSAAAEIAGIAFQVLRQVKNFPEAYRAVKTLHRAATNSELDASVLSAIRQELASLRPGLESS